MFCPRSSGFENISLEMAVDTRSIRLAMGVARKSSDVDPADDHLCRHLSAEVRTGKNIPGTAGSMECFGPIAIILEIDFD
jgi:hypothetical protein